MPLYRFDVAHGVQVTIDRNGVELADDEEARAEAIGLCRHMVRDMRSDGDQYELLVVARNDAGQVVYEASLALNGRWWPVQG